MFDIYSSTHQLINSSIQKRVRDGGFVGALS